MKSAPNVSEAYDRLFPDFVRRMTARRTDAILRFGLYGSERVLYARESREIPRLKAFCRVAPSVRSTAQFDLVLDSRLPKFFDPAGYISPAGYKARVEYYSSPDSVRVIIYDPSGHKVFDK